MPAAPDPGGESQESWKGLAYALSCYLMWGFFPVYWKQLAHVDALQILAHRMVWSLVFVGLVLGIRGRWSWLRELRSRPGVVGAYFLAAIFLAVNWWLYIWSVNSGYVVETALGYFINPLLNVVFGALLLGERPRRVQWAAIGLAGLGVVYLTVVYGQPPWIALVLAGTFGTYGLIKKKASLGALEGLSLETSLLFLPALGFLAWTEWGGAGAFGHVGRGTDLLLVFAGVATALPLLLFGAGLRRMTLTTLGVLQYLAPSIQFVLGVWVYGEAFSVERMVGFVFIWSGLALYTVESVVRSRRERRWREKGVASRLG